MRAAVHSVSTTTKLVTLPANALYAEIVNVGTAGLRIYGTQPYVNAAGTSVGAASVTVGAVSAADPKPSYVSVPVQLATVTANRLSFPCNSSRAIVAVGVSGKSIVRIMYYIGKATPQPNSGYSV